MPFAPVPNSVGAMFRLMFVAMAGVSATIAAARRLNAIEEEIQKYRDDIMRQHQSAVITTQRVREFTSSPKRAEALLDHSQIAVARSRGRGRCVDLVPTPLVSSLVAWLDEHASEYDFPEVCSLDYWLEMMEWWHFDESRELLEPCILNESLILDESRELLRLEKIKQPRQEVDRWIESVEPEFRAELEADLESLIREGYAPSIPMLQATLDRLRLAKEPDYKYSSRGDR